jgi:hypothetical protein
MPHLSRRSFVRGVTGLAVGGLLLHGGRATAQVAGGPAWTPIGFTQAGEPLIVHHLGEGARRVLILGGQHGGPEANTIRLARGLMAHFVDNPGALPPSITLDILPIANPDGATAGSRQFLSGVDPNRNWGGPDWQTDASDSNGQFRHGLGGPQPFSEQETRALADLVIQTQPALVINYHSAGGFMFGGRDGPSGEIAAIYSETSGYPRPVPGAGSSPLPYRATGSMNVWLREIGIQGLFVELTTPYDSELDRNLAALRAVLARLA